MTEDQLELEEINWLNDTAASNSSVAQMCDLILKNRVIHSKNTIK